MSAEAQAKIERFLALKDKMPHSELPRWSLAQAYEAAGRTLDAFREYGELVTLKPDYCLAWLRLGALALHELADPRVARESLEEARRLAVAQGHAAPRLEAEALLDELAESED